MKLSEKEIDTRLAELAHWGRTDGKWIERKYRFAEFMDSIRFTNRVAEEAERLNHHPMIAIDFRMVTLRLTSWSAGGLTALDFEAAQHFEAVYASMEK
ncbi:4a-hydroxytetrahydrobiopterin dehydratase [Paenibacillus turpanensis]|uniref:4a-hydroxytetrahydrobiopterin dehydratase n=1 Tax=Paenibacillus turpanensis TaxID=2689078 RepID=UPI00140B7CC1|nr:4a-hydroxytetrahydrobiopterin dehydratase [Paenibacillus turpanensis]